MRVAPNGAASCPASDHDEWSTTLIATRPVTRVRPNEGAPLATPAGTFSVKLEAEETNGADAVAVASVPPPLHWHPFGETFWVLTGTFEFSTVGEYGVETAELGSGALFHVPPDAPHTFKNVGATTGTLLVIASPVLVEFLREIAAMATPEGPPDLAKVAPIMQKYQFEFVGPTVSHQGT